MPDAVAALLVAPGAHLIVHAVGGAPQRQFAQGEQVALAKEVFNSALCAIADVDLALFQALAQIVRRQIHQHDLIGAVEKGVGNGFAHANAGNAAYDVVKAFKVLHVDGGDHVDARVQQLVDILPALGMARSLHVGVRQLVHQDHRRMARQRRVQIELGMTRAAGGAPRQHHEPAQQAGGLFPPVRLYHADQHVEPLRAQPLRLLQHGVGFTYPRAGAEVDFQLAAMAVGLLQQQRVGIGAFAFVVHYVLQG